LPVAAVVRETAVYLRQHLILEPWGTMSPIAVIAARARPPRRCPECGAEAGADDAYCRACGHEMARTQVPSGG
jgi:hypothetical protein